MSEQVKQAAESIITEINKVPEGSHPVVLAMAESGRAYYDLGYKMGYDAAVSKQKEEQSEGEIA